MSALEDRLGQLPEHWKDLRLNLTTLLRDAKLPTEERFAVAVAVAQFARSPALAAALVDHAGTELSAGAAEDAAAAAGLMAMTTVYYRAIHLMDAPEYQHMQPRLRLQRMFNVKTNKRLFELCALGCAAVAGCGQCLTAHQHSLREAGASPEEVHEAIRIAAVVHAVAVVLAV